MIAIEKTKTKSEIDLDIIPAGLEKPKRVVIKISEENKDILNPKKEK